LSKEDLSEEEYLEARPGLVRPDLDGKPVKIYGWVHEIRDLGSLVFLLLRDRTGLCQVVFNRSKVGEDGG
jgi:aspartyl-tRNA synthetase